MTRAARFTLRQGLQPRLVRPHSRGALGTICRPAGTNAREVGPGPARDAIGARTVHTSAARIDAEAGVVGVRRSGELGALLAG